MSLSDDFPWLEGVGGIFDPVVEGAGGVVEPFLTIGSAIGAEIPAGLYGLYETAVTGSPRAGAEAVREFQDRYTYLPRTEGGQRALGSLAEGIDAAMNYRGLGASPNELIAEYQTQAGRLGAGPAALLEGVLAAGPTIPARAGAFARLADDLPMESRAIPQQPRLTVYEPPVEGLLAEQPLLDLPDPRLASGPMKATLGKALAPLSKPGVRARERLRQGGETIINEAQRAEGRLLDPESLLGSVLVPVAGDRTRAGGRLQQVRGVPLRGALELEGGPGFSEQHAGTGAAWASMKPAAASKQANITKAAEATGARPVGVYTAMSPEGSNFSHHVAEGMLRQMPNLDVSKGAKQRFDNFVRNKAAPSQRIPDWVGIESDYALDQILGQGDFPMEGSGEIRKRLVNAMSSAQFRDVGFPSYVDTLEAVNDPRLAGQGVGSSGLVMFEGAPGAPLIRETGHSSYSHDIPGEYIGGLAESVPLDVMFPKTVGRLMDEGKTNIPRSFQMSHQWELADEEWLEGIMQYLRENTDVR